MGPLVVGSTDGGGTADGLGDILDDLGGWAVGIDVQDVGTPLTTDAGQGGDDATTPDPVARHFQHDQGGEDLGKVEPEQGVRQFVELALMLQQVAHVRV